MIRKLKEYKIKTLNRISPSQYYSAINCPYKLVLANSLENQILLPFNANAYFGTVIHKMIELISKGIITEEDSFTSHWVQLITAKEEELRQKGLESITPLKYFVADFALKKNQLKRILGKKLEKSNNIQKKPSNIYFPEKKLENNEKTIAGIADLIIENEFGVTILDFKSGKIYSDAIDENGKIEQLIKKEYEIQLKLYAHLYFLMHGKYPKALFIVSLNYDFVEVKFEESDCEKIYSEALNFITNTNLSISNNQINSLAKPSIENCKYCFCRPACSYYKDWLSLNFEMLDDLFGVIEKVNSFNNDTIGLLLQTNGKQILVNGLPAENKNYLEAYLGKKLMFYNLKKTKQSLNATANNYTVIYE